MGKFIYCSNQDELEWFVGLDNLSQPCYSLRLDRNISAYTKNQIRLFIEQSCQARVYAWTGIMVPGPHDIKWAQKLVPNSLQLYFEMEEDMMIMLLKFSNYAERI